MARVTGLGGIFFKTRNPKAIHEWYEKHLGIRKDADGSVVFKWRHLEAQEHVGYTVWGPFSHDTKYFGPGPSPYMINFRVDDLNGLLKRLRNPGVQVEKEIEESEYGRFGWITDPDGNRVELWEPPEGS